MSLWSPQAASTEYNAKAAAIFITLQEIAADPELPTPNTENLIYPLVRRKHFDGYQSAAGRLIRQSESAAEPAGAVLGIPAATDRILT